jgi:hypothetical protein
MLLGRQLYCRPYILRKNSPQHVIGMVMLTFIRRAVLPVLLVIGGLASLVYGVKFHVVPVLAEEKTEVSIDMPDPLQSSMPGMQSFDEPPRMRKQTVERTVEVTINLSEPALIRDVTVGGVVLNKSGDIMRTYSGKPPSLCPT